jgi:hypothetical protein
MREIAKDVGISKNSVSRVLTQDLGMRKISVRWVSRILTPFDKARRVLYFQENLDFVQDELNFSPTLIIGDET